LFTSFGMYHISTPGGARQGLRFDRDHHAAHPGGMGAGCDRRPGYQQQAIK